MRVWAEIPLIYRNLLEIVVFKNEFLKVKSVESKQMKKLLCSALDCVLIILYRKKSEFQQKEIFNE